MTAYFRVMRSPRECSVSLNTATRTTMAFSRKKSLWSSTALGGPASFNSSTKMKTVSCPVMRSPRECNASLKGAVKDHDGVLTKEEFEDMLHQRVGFGTYLQMTNLLPIESRKE